jgi:hypothetical protein
MRGAGRGRSIRSVASIRPSAGWAEGVRRLSRADEDPLDDRLGREREVADARSGGRHDSPPEDMLAFFQATRSIGPWRLGARGLPAGTPDRCLLAGGRCVTPRRAAALQELVRRLDDDALSPVFASLSHALRCSRLMGISPSARPRETGVLDIDTKPTPQASCSRLGS